VFDRFLQPALRRHDCRGTLDQNELIALQLFDPRFAGFHDWRAAGLHNPVQQAFDLYLDLCQLPLDHFLRGQGMSEPGVPRINEHGLCHDEQA
jgi:hypothetical protein